MNNDQIQQMGDSLIQHGKASERVYLMKLAQNDFPEIIPRLTKLAESQGYTKIFAKIPAFAKESFIGDGYRVEASIPRFYQSKESAFFMARYFHPRRKEDNQQEQIDKVLNESRQKAATVPKGMAPTGLSCRLAGPLDYNQMAKLYKQVFQSYPFPIHDPNYLQETMADNVIYAGIWQGQQLLALASAEADYQGGNAEMTDFATHADWQGNGLATYLMVRLEEEMAKRAITTCYTIARATSYGMNICFARNGYTYSGTLVKNTQISGGLESMNVWYKHL